METGINFVDCYEIDIVCCVMAFLDDPGDLVRACAVSRSWREFVISNSLCKKQCLIKVPAISSVARVIEVNGETNKLEEGEFRNPINPDTLEKENRIYSYFLRAISSSMGNSKGCLAYAVGASCTLDLYRIIGNTLVPTNQEPWGDSYWSSKGQSDPSMPEYLLYKFLSGISVVTEINIRPYGEPLEPERPVYSAMSVRFRMGHPKSRSDTDVDIRSCASQPPVDKYVWTYTSPEFPMMQDSSVQVYKLPEPAINFGGYLLIELLGRAQRDERDGLFYTRISHTRFLGWALEPEFSMEMEASGELVLKYYPDSHRQGFGQGMYEEMVPSVDHPEFANTDELEDWLIAYVGELLDNWELNL